MITLMSLTRVNPVKFRLIQPLCTGCLPKTLITKTTGNCQKPMVANALFTFTKLVYSNTGLLLKMFIATPVTCKIRFEIMLQVNECFF